MTHTFRVAVAPCTHCGTRQRIFPHALVTLTSRVERNLPEAFLACPNGHLFKGRRDRICLVPTCDEMTDPAQVYTPRRVVTCQCGQQDRLEARAPRHRVWPGRLCWSSGPAAAGENLRFPLAES